MAGDMAFIRRNYGVPARRGMPIEFDGMKCRILGAGGSRLSVVMNDPKWPGRKGLLHPTWRAIYPKDLTL